MLLFEEVICIFVLDLDHGSNLKEKGLESLGVVVSPLFGFDPLGFEWNENRHIWEFLRAAQDFM